jgi:hypothetical protein
MHGARAKGRQIRPQADPHSAPQKEARQRHARGATLQELAHSYDVGISTIRRATRAA